MINIFKFAVLALLFLQSTISQADEKIEKGPWRVFILTGQSNMEGKGAIKHLEQLLADEKTASKYKHLRTNNQWTKRNDILIRYTNDDKIDMKGPLSVGYANPANRFGPELQFGHVVANHFKERVLLIKICWGGRSLRFDFRPPSSGTDLDKVGITAEQLQKIADKKKHTGDPKQLIGHNYRDLVRLTHETLANLEKHFPEYDGNGYEISGLVWFQGWNDMIDGNNHYQYGPNLANLLRDLRTDLGVKDLPMIVGEAGQSGLEKDINKRYRAKHMSFRSQQKSVEKVAEFNGRAKYVPIGQFMIHDGPQFDGGYHYRGRADHFFDIGNAFGLAMIPLTHKTPQDQRKSINQAWANAKKKYNFK